MEVYTVKQVADMLQINPETIRRWIRQKKLIAIQDSRKDGNVITQDSLNNFLRSMPKYAGVVGGIAGLGVASPLGLPLLASSLVGAIVSKNTDNIDNSLVFSEDLERYLNTELELHEKNIKIKEKNIEQIKIEIEAKKMKIDELKKLIERKNKKNDSDNSKENVEKHDSK